MSEGAGENLFVIKNGVIYTPDLSAGALNGITRNTIFHIVATWAWNGGKAHHPRRGLHLPTKLFTGTAAEVTPIRELRPHPDRQRLRGPITEKIQNASSTSSTAAILGTRTG